MNRTLVRIQPYSLCLLLAACAAGTQAPATIHVRAPGAEAKQYLSQGPRDARTEALLDLTALNLTSDTRLAALARFAAGYWQSYGAAPSHRLLDFAAHHLGLFEPAPHLALLSAAASDLPGLLQSELADLTQRGQYTHVGAFLDQQGSFGRAVLVLSFRHLEMDQVPRNVAAGAPISLRGSLRSGFRAPTLVVVRPDGRVERTTLGVGPAFATELRAQDPGVLRIELLAEGHLGTSVVANFPVYVATQAPTSITLDRRPEDDDASGPLDDQLFALLNRARAAAGLQPLVRDRGLDAVAEKHNADMIASGFVGHSSPNTGTAVDRVTRAQLPTSLVLENIGRDDSAAAIHEGWMESPGHRENLLHTQATHVGLYVDTLVAEDDGRPSLLATQVFIRRTPPLPEDATEQLLAAINRARRERGHAPVELDSTLSDLCQAAAKRHFAQPSLPVSQNLSDLQRAQRDAGTGFARLATTLIVTSVLEEIASEPQLLVPEVSAIGLGIAQGTRIHTEPNAIAVVLSLAYASRAR